EAPNARWITFSTPVGGPEEITVSASPILAAPALEENLWQDCFAAILTSATLSALGSFDFLSLRAGLHEDTVFRRIASPFDFNNAVLRVPDTGCDPADAEGHTNAIAEALPELLEDESGALV